MSFVVLQKRLKSDEKASHTDIFTLILFYYSLLQAWQKLPKMMMTTGTEERNVLLFSETKSRRQI